MGVVTNSLSKVHKVGPKGLPSIKISTGIDRTEESVGRGVTNLKIDIYALGGNRYVLDR